MPVKPRLAWEAIVLLVLLTGATAFGQTPPVDAARDSSGLSSSEFVIGPEDVLGILFWRDRDMTGDVEVRPDGRITLPLLGEIVAAGQTSSALASHIQKAAERYMTAPNVTVIVRTINSRKVFITGEVVMPGSYPLTGPRTVMQLIALAGGLTEYAKTEEITVLRQEPTGTRTFKFNYKAVAKGRNLEQNLALQPGDTVLVP